MLANGAKLSYDKTNKGTSFTELPGLKKIPDMGIEKEKVENSSLDDAVKVYEFGIGDPGDLEYTFKYDNSKETSSYRLMRELEKTGATAMFKETLKDGTTTTFSGQVTVKRAGGGVNDAIEFTISIALQSELKIADPGEAVAQSDETASEAVSE